MKRRSVLVCAALLVSACDKMYDAVENAYQSEMDPVRIRHIDFIASLTTEYFQKTGRMPLADRLQEKRITVFITRRPLKGYLEQAARLPVVVLSTDDLKADLEKGLGRTINLPSDPQYVASYGPNLYIYDVNKARACVYGHLFSEAPGAFLVEGKDPGTGLVSRYYKYERCMPRKAV